MKYKILVKQRNLHGFRKVKKISPIPKKLIKQLLKLKAKVKVFMSFFQEYLAPGADCPVLLEPFTQKEPPFKLSSCEHRVTAAVLRKLPITDLTPAFGTACMFCPVCRRTIHFAHSDNTYFQALQIVNQIKQIEEADLSTILGVLKTSHPIEKINTVFFTPTGGVLELWRALIRKNSG